MRFKYNLYAEAEIMISLINFHSFVRLYNNSDLETDFLKYKNKEHENVIYPRDDSSHSGKQHFQLPLFFQCSLLCVRFIYRYQLLVYQYSYYHIKQEKPRFCGSITKVHYYAPEGLVKARPFFIKRPL